MAEISANNTIEFELVSPEKLFKSEPVEMVVIPDRKSTRLNSSHALTSYAVFRLKKKKKITYL